ncbi:MAG: YihY/virulence factor BrkB family protein [Candidatus Gastranaerophilales bacterium]|nr:YihY/virulence factor BrkB family protein [Candidatus Gastranaerophilales bacterium]
MFIRLCKLVFSVAEASFRDDFLGKAAEMAFYSIFAFFPFLVFMVALYSAFGTEELVTQILNYFSVIIPSDVHNYIIVMLREILHSTNATVASFTFIIAMAVASNAMFTFIKGLNKAYHVEETRPLWYTRLLSVILLFVTAFVIFLGINALVFGKIIFNFILSFGILPKQTVYFISFIRWPIIFLALYAVIFTNYYLMPNIHYNPKAKFFSTIPGTFFFCFAWIISSWLFSVYLNHFNMYSKLYGALAVFAIFLIWLYYTSFIVLLGGEVNSKFYDKLKDEERMLNTII